ncbi:MAG: DUF1194 domain-containing protein [Rhodospirillaceae bacterium]
MNLRLSILSAFASLAITAPAYAQGDAVDLALILAVDVSMSIDEGEAGVQRIGYIHALRDERVAEAIQSGPIGRIAIAYMEWSSVYHQRVVVPWRIVSDLESTRAFAAELDEAPLKSGSTTSISGGIDFAVDLFSECECEPTRKVIDISGDGYSDYGRPPNEARDEAIEEGITINGLAIMNKRAEWKQAAPDDLDEYYRENVIGGPGSFYIAVRNLNDFSQSVLQKLILEIASLEIPRESRG